MKFTYAIVDPDTHNIVTEYITWNINNNYLNDAMNDLTWYCTLNNITGYYRFQFIDNDGKVINCDNREIQHIPDNNQNIYKYNNTETDWTFAQFQNIIRPNNINYTMINIIYSKCKTYNLDDNILYHFRPNVIISHEWIRKCNEYIKENPKFCFIIREIIKAYPLQE